MTKQTLKEAGYSYVQPLAGGHVLRHLETGVKEFWVANKGHASYGIKWNNTELEFAHSL